MEDYRQRIQIITKDIQRQLEMQPAVNICVSVSALYEDSEQSFKICTAATEMKIIKEAINEVVNNLLKSIKLQVVVYNGKRENKDNIASNTVIGLPSRMDQSKLASIIDSRLSSFQDVDELVETIQQKLKFYDFEGSSIGVREIKQFCLLFRLYDIYKEILYPTHENGNVD